MDDDEKLARDMLNGALGTMALELSDGPPVMIPLPQLNPKQERAGRLALSRVLRALHRPLGAEIRLALADLFDPARKGKGGKLVLKYKGGADRRRATLAFEVAKLERAGEKTNVAVTSVACANHVSEKTVWNALRDFAPLLRVALQDNPE